MKELLRNEKRQWRLVVEKGLEKRLVGRDGVHEESRAVL